MEDSPMEELETMSPMVRRVFAVGVAAVLVVACFGYAIYEHHAATNLTAENQQMSAELTATQSQVSHLTAAVKSLEASELAQAAQSAASQQPAVAQSQRPIVRHVGKPRAGRPLLDRRLTRMQAQLDEQQQEIAATRGDLANTTTQLSGNIARNHDELVVLEKRGQRNYFEFDLQKEKQFKREGPLGVSLRKANVKHQYADLQLLVDDRSLTQKHVNLDQPVMFYGDDSEQPIEVVINDISKNHIHGYVSAPAYRKSELVSMAQAADGSGTNSAPQPAQRTKLTVPQE